MEENRPHPVLVNLTLPGYEGIELMKAILGIGDVPPSSRKRVFVFR